MDDPFAALVEEMNLTSSSKDNDNDNDNNKNNNANANNNTDNNDDDNNQNKNETTLSPTNNDNENNDDDDDNNNDNNIDKIDNTQEKPQVIEYEPKPQQSEEEPQPQQLEEQQEEEEEEEEDEEEEEEEEEVDNDELISSISNISSISELRSKYIEYHKLKENEIYELKNKFTEISRRQKEVFMEVENRWKTAVSKGKKYKQTAQKLHYQIQKLNNDLKFERKKNNELNDEISIIRDQKKQREEAIEQLTNNINLLKSSLNQTEKSKDQILDEFKQTHNVIDKLIQNEKIQEKLKCYIQIEEKQDEQQQQQQNNGNKGGIIHKNENLCIAKLKFIDNTIDTKSISIQWNRSYFTQLLSIKNANKTSYRISADDIGSIIKCEVRSKDNPDCYETAILKNGPVKMNKICTKIVQENLLKIAKQQIEFRVEPDLSESNTSKLLSKIMKNTKDKQLILHFNKDKIKLRTPKNSTIDKEQYNNSMKITLSAMNPNRFSFKFSSSKKYVFLTKTPLQRDNIAILLRCYIERLQRNNNNFLCEFYLRLSNEKTNNDILNKNNSINNGDTLTRDQLITKILAPISSNPRILDSFTNISSNNSNSLHSINSLNMLQPSSIIGGVIAPISNTITNNNNTPEFNVDEIFPDFNPEKKENDNNNKDKKKKKITKTKQQKQQKQQKPKQEQQEQQEQEQETIEKKEISNGGNTENDEIIIDDQDNIELQQEKQKAAWKKMQFEENAQIASEQELQSNLITPAPKKKSTKSKKKKRKQQKPQKPQKQQEQKQQETKQEIKQEIKQDKTKKKENKIELMSEFSDRLDCLLNTKGEIIKYQVVGSLSLKYENNNDDDDNNDDNKYFYGIVSNLENTKTKIFNPLTTETLDNNGKIRVKLNKNEKNIGVLKYVWNTDEIRENLPFFIELNTEFETEKENENIYNISCIITPNNNNKYKYNEFSITGTLKDDILECIDYTKQEKIEFIWNNNLSKKFIWSIKNNLIENKLILNSKFKSSTNDNKVQLKIQFEIKDIGISTIEIKNDDDNKNNKNNINIIKTIKNMRSGEFILR